MKTRPLIPGEHFEPGDYYRDDPSSTAQSVGLVGQEVLVTCWERPVKEDNWIAFSDRKPTKEDADGEGNIAIYYDDANYAVVRRFDLGTAANYWMPLNFVPREPTRIKVDGHEVVPNKNGSIKVGCQTVSSQDFEEIVRQRAEAMK